MKKNLILIAFWALGLSPALLQDIQAQTTVASSSQDTAAAKYQSIKNEIMRAIERGNEYLKEKQNPDGYWSSKAYPAMTALALTAALRDPMFDHNKEWPEYIKKGYSFLTGNQKSDGGIYARGLASYNTSVSMLGLLAANKSEYEPAILKARKFLINQQNHFAPDNPYNGGIGYGDENSPQTADLSNTSLALEALYYSKEIAEDGKHGKQPDLNWDAAIEFISRCQDLPETNDQPWAKETTENKGGFAYRPSNENPKEDLKAVKPAEKTENKPGEKAVAANEGQKPGAGAPEGRPTGKPPGARGGPGGKPQADAEEKTPLRSYGSMSYAGLQSLIYAQVSKDDPRVKAVIAWLARNFSVEENPGVGPQGLYYYYQTMSKTLSAAGIDELTLTDGRKIDWREKLAKAVINKQQSDGSWVNSNNRWWESDPILVTSYTVLALEQLYNSIPEATKK